MFKIAKLFISISIPTIFTGFVLYIMPIREKFQFNNDEGLNLLTAFMYSQGFSLYKDIWHDQPPIFPIILSSWLTWFGHSVFAARILVVIFSAILVWSFYEIISYFLGIIPALFSTSLLVVSRDFFKLSVSAMVGFPCIALVMLSIYTLILYQKKTQKILLILSGTLFALSLQTKLFSIIILPPIISLILYFNLTKKSSLKITPKIFYNIFVWLLTIFIVYLIIGILFNSLNYEQIWEAHNIGKTSYGKLYNINLLRQRLDGNNLIFSCLAFVGILLIFIRRKWEAIVPLTWLVTSLIFLLKHKPIWYHHYIMIFIPLAWLSGYVVSFVIDFFQKENWYYHFKSFEIKKIIFPSIAAVLLLVSMNTIRIKIPKSKKIASKDISIEAVTIL